MTVTVMAAMLPEGGKRREEDEVLFQISLHTGQGENDTQQLNSVTETLLMLGEVCCKHKVKSGR